MQKVRYKEKMAITGNAMARSKEMNGLSMEGGGVGGDTPVVSVMNPASTNASVVSMATTMGNTKSLTLSNIRSIAPSANTTTTTNTLTKASTGMAKPQKFQVINATFNGVPKTILIPMAPNFIVKQRPLTLDTKLLSVPSQNPIPQNMPRVVTSSVQGAPLLINSSSNIARVVSLIPPTLQSKIVTSNAPASGTCVVQLPQSSVAVPPVNRIIIPSSVVGGSPIPTSNFPSNSIPPTNMQTATSIGGLKPSPLTSILKPQVPGFVLRVSKAPIYRTVGPAVVSLAPQQTTPTIVSTAPLSTASVKLEPSASSVKSDGESSSNESSNDLGLKIDSVFSLIGDAASIAPLAPPLPQSDEDNDLEGGSAESASTDTATEDGMGFEDAGNSETASIDYESDDQESEVEEELESDSQQVEIDEHAIKEAQEMVRDLQVKLNIKAQLTQDDNLGESSSKDICELLGLEAPSEKDVVIDDAIGCIKDLPRGLELRFRETGSSVDNAESIESREAMLDSKLKEILPDMIMPGVLSSKVSGAVKQTARKSCTGKALFRKGKERTNCRCLPEPNVNGKCECFSSNNCTEPKKYLSKDDELDDSPPKSSSVETSSKLEGNTEGNGAVDIVDSGSDVSCNCLSPRTKVKTTTEGSSEAKTDLFLDICQGLDDSDRTQKSQTQSDSSTCNCSVDSKKTCSCKKGLQLPEVVEATSESLLPRCEPEPDELETLEKPQVINRIERDGFTSKGGASTLKAVSVCQKQGEDHEKNTKENVVSAEGKAKQLKTEVNSGEELMPDINKSDVVGQQGDEDKAGNGGSNHDTTRVTSDVMESSCALDKTEGSCTLSPQSDETPLEETKISVRCREKSANVASEESSSNSTNDTQFVTNCLDKKQENNRQVVNDFTNSEISRPMYRVNAETLLSVVGDKPQNNDGCLKVDLRDEKERDVNSKEVQQDSSDEEMFETSGQLFVNLTPSVVTNVPFNPMELSLLQHKILSAITFHDVPRIQSTPPPQELPSVPPSPAAAPVTTMFTDLQQQEQTLSPYMQPNLESEPLESNSIESQMNESENIGTESKEENQSMDLKITSVISLKDLQSDALTIMNAVPLNTQSLTPQPLNSQSSNPQSLNPTPLNTQSWNPQPLNPQSLNPQLMTTQLLSPDSLNTQPVNLQPVSPLQLNLHTLNPTSLNPHSINAQIIDTHSLNTPSMNIQVVNPQPISLQSLNTQSLDALPLSAQSQNMQSLNPHNLNAQSQNAQSQNMQSLNPPSQNTQSINPQNMNVQSLNPQTLNSLRSEEESEDGHLLAPLTVKDILCGRRRRRQPRTVRNLLDAKRAENSTQMNDSSEASQDHVDAKTDLKPDIKPWEPRIYRRRRPRKRTKIDLKSLVKILPRKAGIMTSSILSRRPIKVESIVKKLDNTGYVKDANTLPIINGNNSSPSRCAPRNWNFVNVGMGMGEEGELDGGGFKSKEPSATTYCIPKKRRGRPKGSKNRHPRSHESEMRRIANIQTTWKNKIKKRLTLNSMSSVNVDDLLNGELKSILPNERTENKRRPNTETSVHNMPYPENTDSNVTNIVGANKDLENSNTDGGQSLPSCSDDTYPAHLETKTKNKNGIDSAAENGSLDIKNAPEPKPELSSSNSYVSINKPLAGRGTLPASLGVVKRRRGRPRKNQSLSGAAFRNLLKARQATPGGHEEVCDGDFAKSGEDQNIYGAALKPHVTNPKLKRPRGRPRKVQKLIIKKQIITEGSKEGEAVTSWTEYSVSTSGSKKGRPKRKLPADDININQDGAQLCLDDKPKCLGPSLNDGNDTSGSPPGTGYKRPRGRPRKYPRKTEAVIVTDSSPQKAESAIKLEPWTTPVSEEPGEVVSKENQNLSKPEVQTASTDSGDKEDEISISISTCYNRASEGVCDVRQDNVIDMTAAQHVAEPLPQVSHQPGQLSVKSEQNITMGDVKCDLENQTDSGQDSSMGRINRLREMLKKQEQALAAVRKEREENRKVLEDMDI